MTIGCGPATRDWPSVDVKGVPGVGLDRLHPLARHRARAPPKPAPGSIPCGRVSKASRAKRGRPRRAERREGLRRLLLAMEHEFLRPMSCQALWAFGEEGEQWRVYVEVFSPGFHRLEETEIDQGLEIDGCGLSLGDSCETRSPMRQ
jgi:hypothetical protein